MSRVITGDRRTLGNSWTRHGSCTVDRDGEVIAITTDWICYHSPPGGGGPVYVLGRDAEARDLTAIEVRDLSDLVDAAERSGRVKPAPEPVELAADLDGLATTTERG